MTRVVNSATEQIADQKKTFLETRKQKYDKEFNESKKEIYKDFAKQVDKLKNLPKLRASKDNAIHTSVDPINVCYR